MVMHFLTYVNFYTNSLWNNFILLFHFASEILRKDKWKMMIMTIKWLKERDFVEAHSSAWQCGCDPRLHWGHSVSSVTFQARLTHWGRDKMADIFQTTFSHAFSWMKNVWIFIKISMKFVPKGPIDKIPSLVQIMAWRRPGDKPLSETMMVSLLMHICGTRPHWFKVYQVVCQIRLMR